MQRSRLDNGQGDQTNAGEDQHQFHRRHQGNAYHPTSIVLVFFHIQFLLLPLSLSEMQRNYSGESPPLCAPIILYIPSGRKENIPSPKKAARLLFALLAVLGRK